jgi:hypothetical protein
MSELARLTGRPPLPGSPVINYERSARPEHLSRFDAPVVESLPASSAIEDQHVERTLVK